MDEPQLNEDGTKTCPQCAERVQGAALVCRFCGQRFDGKPAPVAPGETSTSGVAVAAFICALLDLWIAAIPLGIHARRQIDQSGGRKTGRVFATAGIILGVVGMVASVVVVIALVSATKSVTTGSGWSAEQRHEFLTDCEKSNVGTEGGVCECVANTLEAKPVDESTAATAVEEFTAAKAAERSTPGGGVGEETIERCKGG
jgi:hypothetical protein